MKPVTQYRREIMPRVSSSAIVRIHYDAARRALDVVFVTGRIYRYFDMPAETYRRFVEAPSKGKFFNAEIIDRFRFEEIT
jgi:KTSC domain